MKYIALVKWSLYQFKNLKNKVGFSVIGYTQPGNVPA
jgi:hypothetical protein